MMLMKIWVPESEMRKTNKIPYWIVIGDKEIVAQKVTLESRDSGNLGQMSKEDLLSKLLTEIKEKKN